MSKQPKLAEEDNPEAEDITAEAEQAPPLVDEGKRSVGSVSFPIEGQSGWIKSLRMLFFSTIGLVTLMAGSYPVFADTIMEGRQFGLIMCGMALILFFLYFFFLTFVVPRSANYGRFKIYENRVEYYPISNFGLGVKDSPIVEKPENLLGIMLKTGMDPKGKKPLYTVYLVSREKSRTVVAAQLNSPEQAKAFATDLSKGMRVPLIPSKKRT